MTKQELDYHFEYVRQMQGTVKALYESIEHEKTDDATRLRSDYDTLLNKLKALLRHEYDCEN